MPVDFDSNDITTPEDVDQLVRTFYGKVLKDELLAPYFAGIDLAHHLPRMVAFWALILLDQEGYKGNVYDKHAHLKVDNRHFDRWVELFSSTVDECFAGEKAELAKQRAKLLQYTFVSKMEKGKTTT
jgi:hemoglobin